MSAPWVRHDSTERTFCISLVITTWQNSNVIIMTHSNVRSAITQQMYIQDTFIQGLDGKKCVSRLLRDFFFGIIFFPVLSCRCIHIVLGTFICMMRALKCVTRFRHVWYNRLSGIHVCIIYNSYVCINMQAAVCGYIYNTCIYVYV